MAVETTAFSTSAEEAITRMIDVSAPPPSQTLSAEQFEAYYEIRRTVREIVDNDYHRTALQFPDELLHDSVPIYHALKAEIGNRELYVLADTTYGSCCVDEVAAQHVDANAIVHYGHAFTKMLTALDELVAGLQTALEPLGIAIHHTPVPLKTVPVPQLPVKSGPQTDNANPEEKSQGHLDGPAEPILWIGPDSLALTNLLLTSFTSPFPARTAQAASPRTPTSRLLKKRYAALSRARSADVFGILVSSPSPTQLPLLRHIRARIRERRKKSYTVSVGKVNPQKLGNFAEVECWVLVACGENSLVDGKEFMRPVITPFELELALAPTPKWTGRYVLDLDTVLKEGEGACISFISMPSEKSYPNHTFDAPADAKATKSSAENDGESGSDDERPVFSALTGKYRQPKVFSLPAKSIASTDPSSTDVILRNRDTAVTAAGSAAADFLASRTYQGLEQRTGMDSPSLLEQGRSGIARGYKDVDHHVVP
ncbi:hypothetical protein HWV62_12622 [Athelia sp. TMB]|nr:hypothetical protein HWV62_12622 [Athelia sp. TMB]